MSAPTPPDHGPMTDDLDAMTYADLRRVLRLATFADDLRALVLAVGAELEYRDRRRDHVRAAGCDHGLDRRCLDCATDDEVLAAVPPFGWFG